MDNNKNNNNPNNNGNNLNIIPIQNYYINQELYPLIRNFKNINPDNLNIINITGDGNCLFRSLSYFLYNNEDNYKQIRKEIFEYSQTIKSIIPNVFIDTEKGKMKIHDYINIINTEGLYGVSWI